MTQYRAVLIFTISKTFKTHPKAKSFYLFKEAIWANAFWAGMGILASDLCISLRQSSEFGRRKACQAGALWVPLIPTSDQPGMVSFHPSKALSAWQKSPVGFVTPAITSHMPVFQWFGDRTLNLFINLASSTLPAQ